MLSEDEQAEVERINTALQAENAAVSTASSNLVVATFSAPSDKEKIARANEELAKARQAWAAKASQLLADAPPDKLTTNALAVLVQNAGGGRGGRGGFGAFGFGGRGFGPPGFGGSPSERAGQNQRGSRPNADQ